MPSMRAFSATRPHQDIPLLHRIKKDHEVRNMARKKKPKPAAKEQHALFLETAKAVQAEDSKERFEKTREDSENKEDVAIPVVKT